MEAYGESGLFHLKFREFSWIDGRISDFPAFGLVLDLGGSLGSFSADGHDALGEVPLKTLDPLSQRPEILDARAGQIGGGVHVIRGRRNPG